MDSSETLKGGEVETPRGLTKPLGAVDREERPRLLAFIDQVIVPLLVKRSLTTGHLYRAGPWYYDDEDEVLGRAA